MQNHSWGGNESGKSITWLIYITIKSFWGSIDTRAEWQDYNHKILQLGKYKHQWPHLLRARWNESSCPISWWKMILSLGVTIPTPEKMHYSVIYDTKYLLYLENNISKTWNRRRLLWKFESVNSYSDEVDCDMLCAIFIPKIIRSNYGGSLKVRETQPFV